MKVLRLLLLCALAQPAVTLAAVRDATVERVSPTQLALHWTDDAPVAVYVSTDPEATPATATPVAAAAQGTATYADAGPERRYFVLRDTRDSSVVRVAERSIPLERGSNFRDVGGYRTTDGRTIRWGQIYRSGAMPMLSEADYTRWRRWASARSSTCARSRSARSRPTSWTTGRARCSCRATIRSNR